MAKRKSSGRSNLGGYKSYAFKDHDPILDQFDTLRSFANEQRDRPLTDAELERLSGVRAGTFGNWRRRKTKRPQFACMKAAVRSIGGRLSIIYNGKEIGRN